MSSEYENLNVPEIDETPSIRVQIAELVFIANARALPARRVPLTAALQVADRVLSRSPYSDTTARAFAVERAVERFLELATKGARADQLHLEHLDLLPVSHPLSTAPVTITASALDQARAEWLAADPRIADEIRPLVAAACTMEFGSIEREHALARLEATPRTELPLEIVLAAANFTGGNSRLARSARARRQLRDRLKRFAYEGGGGKFLLRLGEKVKDMLGLTVGGSADGKTVEIYMDKDDPEFGIKKGDILPVNTENFEAAAVLLTDEQLAKAGIKLPKSKVSSAKRAQDVKELLANKLEAPSDWKKKSNGDWGTEDGFTATPLGDNKYLLKDENGNPVPGLDAAEWPAIQEHIMKVAEDEYGNGLPNVDERPEGEQVSPASVRKNDVVTNPKNNEVRMVKDVFKNEEQTIVYYDDGEKTTFPADNADATITKLPDGTPLSEPKDAFRKKKADEFAADKKKADDHNAWVKEKKANAVKESTDSYPEPKQIGEENGHPVYEGHDGGRWVWSDNLPGNGSGWVHEDKNGVIRAEIRDNTASGYSGTGGFGVTMLDEKQKFDSKAQYEVGGYEAGHIIYSLNEAISGANAVLAGKRADSARKDVKAKPAEKKQINLGPKGLTILRQALAKRAEQIKNDPNSTKEQQEEAHRRYWIARNQELDYKSKSFGYFTDEQVQNFIQDLNDLHAADPELAAESKGVLDALNKAAGVEEVSPEAEKKAEPELKPAPKNPPSKKQAEMIRSMLKERVLTPEQRQGFMDRLAQAEKGDINGLFNELKAMPKAKVALTDANDPLNQHADPGLAKIKQALAPFDLDGSIRRYIDERTANGGEISSQEIHRLLDGNKNFQDSAKAFNEYNEEGFSLRNALGGHSTEAEKKSFEEAKAKNKAEAEALSKKLEDIKQGQADLKSLSEEEHQAKLDELVALISDESDPDRTVRNGILDGTLRTGDEIVAALRKQEVKNIYKTMSPAKFATEWNYLKADEQGNEETWAIIKGAYALPPAPEGFDRKFMANGLQRYDNENGDLAKLINSGGSFQEVMDWLDANSPAWKDRKSDYDTRMFVDMPWPSQKAKWKRFGELLDKMNTVLGEKESVDENKPNTEFVSALSERLPENTISNLDAELPKAFSGDSLSELLGKVNDEEDLQRVVDELSIARASEAVTPEQEALLKKVQDAAIQKFYEDNPNLENTMAEPANIVVPEPKPEPAATDSIAGITKWSFGFANEEGLGPQTWLVTSGLDELGVTVDKVIKFDNGQMDVEFTIPESARDAFAEAYGGQDGESFWKDVAQGDYGTPIVAEEQATPEGQGKPENKTDKPNYETEFTGLREPEFMAEEVGLPPQKDDEEDWSEEELMDAWLKHYGLDKLGVKYGKITPSYNGHDVQLEIPDAAKDAFAKAYANEDSWDGLDGMISLLDESATTEESVTPVDASDLTPGDYIQRDGEAYKVNKTEVYSNGKIWIQTKSASGKLDFFEAAPDLKVDKYSTPPEGAFSGPSTGNGIDAAELKDKLLGKKVVITQTDGTKREGTLVTVKTRKADGSVAGINWADKGGTYHMPGGKIVSIEPLESENVSAPPTPAGNPANLTTTPNWSFDFDLSDPDYIAEEVVGLPEKEDGYDVPEVLDAWLKKHGLDKLGVKYASVEGKGTVTDVEFEIPDSAKEAFAKAYMPEQDDVTWDEIQEEYGTATGAEETPAPFSTANSDKLLAEAKTNRKEIDDVDLAIASILDETDTGYEPMLKGITGNEHVVKNLLDSLDESDGANSIAIAGDLYALHDVLVAQGVAPLVTEHIKDIADAMDEFVPATEGDKNNSVTTDIVIQEQATTLDLGTWKKVGGQKGSNPGGTYENPETGEQVYVKTPKSQLHGENERLASALYDAAGIPSAKVLAGKDADGNDVTYSPIIDGATPDLKKKMKDKDYLARLQQGFAMDALLANWDVIGLDFDNVVTDKNGEPVRVDPGGALLFRAQGSPKGGAFGEDVPELEAFTDKTSSRPSSKIFSQMTEEQKLESAKVLQNLSPSQIDELVNAIITDPGKREELKTKLKARREYILNKFGLGDGGNGGGNGGQEPTPSPEAPQGLQPMSMQDVLKGKMQGSPADTKVLNLGDENIRTEAAKSVQSQLPDGYTVSHDTAGNNQGGYLMIKNAEGETVAMLTGDPDNPNGYAVQNFKAGWKIEKTSSLSEGMSKLVGAVKIVEEPGQVAQLSDGSAGKIGSKVEHIGTGEKGTIVKFDKNPAYVVVQGEDGTKKTKSVNKLKTAGDGGNGGVTQAPTPSAPSEPSAPEESEPTTFIPQKSENMTMFTDTSGNMSKVMVIKTFEGKWDVVYDYNGPDFKPLSTDLASREEAEAKALMALGTNDFTPESPAAKDSATSGEATGPKKFTFDFMGLQDVTDAPEIDPNDPSELPGEQSKIKKDSTGALIKPGAIVKDENGRVGVYRTTGYGDPNKIRMIWEDGTQDSVMPDTVTATGKYLEPGIAGVYAGLADLDFEKKAVPMPDNYSGGLKDKNGKNIGYKQLVVDKNGELGVVIENSSFDGYIKVAYPDGTKKRKADTVTALDLRYDKDEYNIKIAQKHYKNLANNSSNKYNLPSFGVTSKSAGQKKAGSGKFPVAKNAAGAKAQDVKVLGWNESDFPDAPALEQLLASVFDTSKPGAGLRGGSIALDADSVEDLDLRIMAAIGTDNKDAYLLKYKLTSWAGDALANQLVEMIQNGDPRVSVVSGMKVPENKVDGDKISFMPNYGSASYKNGYGETFVITLDDGTKIHFLRADSPTTHKGGQAKIGSNAPRAYHNKVMIIAPKDKSTPESLAMALQTAGVQDVRPSTQADAKILIENRLMSIFDEKVDPKTNLSGEEREQSLARIKDAWGITPENVTISTGAGGRIEMRLDPESAKKIVDKTKVKVLFHNLTGGGATSAISGAKTEEEKRDKIAEYFASRVATPQGGLLSTTTRWTEGIPGGGMSSQTDVTTGGADYVFTKPMSSPSSYSHSLVPQIYFDAERVFQRLDFWANQHDAFGKRVGKSPISQAVPGGYEVMLKGRLSFDDAEVLMVTDEDMRTRLITKLRQRGINEIGGRPLEAVIMTGPEYSAAKKTTK